MKSCGLGTLRKLTRTSSPRAPEGNYAAVALSYAWVSTGISTTGSVRLPAPIATAVIGTAISSRPTARTVPIAGKPARVASRLPVSGPAAVPSEDAEPTRTAQRPRGSREAARPMTYDRTIG